MRDHTKLRAFELADELAVLTYKVTKDFPKEEIYGLTSQMRRSGVSVPSNIVEGCARESQVEFIRFLDISYGSLKEIHYQFGLAHKLGYMQKNHVDEISVKFNETEKVLGALIRTLRNNKLKTKQLTAK